MKRHASPLQPENGALRLTRQRYHGKGTQSMRNNIVGIIAGAALMGAGIAGIALVDASDGTTVKTSGYAEPTCGMDAFNVYHCVGPSPEASPVASETPVTPEATATFTPREVPTQTDAEEVLSVELLPGTGTGSSR